VTRGEVSFEREVYFIQLRNGAQQRDQRWNEHDKHGGDKHLYQGPSRLIKNVPFGINTLKL
jgi:hypothetical protein